MKKLFGWFGVAVSFPLLVFAQGQNATKQESLGVLPPSFKAELGYTVSRSVNLSEEDDYGALLYAGLKYNPKDNSKISASINMWIDQFLSKKDDKNNSQSLRDILVELSHQVQWNPYLSSEAVSLQGTTGNSDLSKGRSKVGSLALKYSMGIEAFGLNLSQYHRVTRGFYTNEFDSGGQPNSPWGYRLLQGVSYPVHDKLSLSAIFIYDVVRSFQGVTKDLFSTDYSLNYQIGESYNLSLGVSSDFMSTKTADGRSDNLKFYDDKTASAYLGFSAVY